jgi:saccharopine dehydrogenase-like NADP-dependent oxidoreductase
VNIAARLGADKLDQVEEIHLRWNVSTADLHEWEDTATVDHIFHAVTDSHPQYLDSHWVNTEGMSGLERAYLPRLGEVDIYYLGNTQAITLPRCIAGVKSVTTKGGFAGLDEFTRNLRELGLLGTDVMQVQGSPLVLRDISAELLSTLADREPDAMPPVGFAAEVSVSGTRKEESLQFRYELADSRSFVHCAGICAALGAMSLVQSEIQDSGVFAPESCMDPGLFFQRLAGYGIELRETQQSTQDLVGRDRGWSLKKQRLNQ